MLQRIARLAIAGPRRILAAAVLVLVAAAIFGLPVAKSLSAGGFQDPAAESAQAIKLLADKFGQSDQQLVIMVTAPDGAQSGQARRAASDIVTQVRASPGVYNVVSAWNRPTAGPSQLAADLVSKDGKSGLIVANLEGGENNAQNYAKSIAAKVVHDRDGVTVRAGGVAMVYDQINR
ncbi:MAG TPA: MMPL family transporter, partial [Mycobacterium sp.]|uniref:MMPL family transporter n=1 Tax=Mycobacterium sp. TaxID=1785 RepID=UPI002F420AAC